MPIYSRLVYYAWSLQLVVCMNHSRSRRKLLFTLRLCSYFIRFFLRYYVIFAIVITIFLFITCPVNIFIFREIRPNGNLYFPPFPEQSYMPEIHAATYKCALENPVGRIVSRESRIKAGTDLCKYLIFVPTFRASTIIIYVHHWSVTLIILFIFFYPWEKLIQRSFSTFLMHIILLRLEY